MTSPNLDRPVAYELNSFSWNLRRVPETIMINGRTEPHPGRHGAIFVVHGMGEQQWTDTSAGIRSGFEDALEAIRKWQEDNPTAVKMPERNVPPPFTYEGFWADYAEVDANFPEDCSRFNERERKFFQTLWKTRAFSSLGTYFWVLRQLLRLANPCRVFKVGFPAWMLYVSLLAISPLVLTGILIYAPRILTRILSDVRLYARPKGIAERAIVQRIDFRVGREFLRLIGLDWDFRPLLPAECVISSGVPVVFDRIIWVAHSLGTVVSYNVLSDLFRRAKDLEATGDTVQKQCVESFRRSLCRFVTIGSPLDKFAILFPDALRPWDTSDRKKLLMSGEAPSDQQTSSNSEVDGREWWINYYHGLDPISGSLGAPLICGSKPPVNLHTEWRAGSLVPGWAHVSYWSSLSVLRFILSRVYGLSYLQDRPVHRQSTERQTWWALVSFLIWTILLWGVLIALFCYRIEIALFVWKVLISAVTKFIGGA